MQNNLSMKIKKVAALAGTAIMASSMMMPVMAATLADLPTPFVKNGQFNANIVVGSLGTGAGISSDLAGAVDVAAAFAQKASAAVSSTGSITLTRPTTPGIINSTTNDYLGIKDIVKTSTFNNSVKGFEWLVNKTISTTYNESDIDINVYETLAIIGSANGIRLLEDGKVYLRGGIEYTITGDPIPKGTSEIPIFGKTYQLVDIKTNNNVTFGVMTDVEGLTVGQSVQIPDKATIVIEQFDTINQEVKVKVTASNGTVMFNNYMKADGTSVATKEYDGYMFVLKNIRGVTGSYTVDMSWTKSAIELESGQTIEALEPSLAKWTVEISSSETDGNLTSIKFTSPKGYNDKTILSEGETLNIVDFFNLSFDGWRDLNLTTFSVSPISGISSEGAGAENIFYKNNNSEKVSLAIGGIKNAYTMDGGFRSTPIMLLTTDDEYVFDFSLVNATTAPDNTINSTLSILKADESAILKNITAIANGDGTIVDNSISPLKPTAGTDGTVAANWNEGTAVFSTNGATYNLTYAYDSSANKFGFNITLAAFNAGNYSNLYGTNKSLMPEFNRTLTWTQNAAQILEFTQGNDTMSGSLAINGSEVVIDFKDNSIDAVKVDSTALAVGSKVYSLFGSIVSRETSGVEITSPQTRRYANVWIGRSSTETKNVAVGQEIEGDGWTVEGASVSSSGGVTPIVPGVGRSDVEYSSPVSLTKPTIVIGGGNANKLTAELAANSEGIATADLVAANNRAYIELIENAFGGSQTVLVIAGRDAKDTKVACQALAAHVLGTKTLSLTGTKAWLDTTSSNYNSVSVVAE